MTQEIVFHLGDSKTGSTSIQETLSGGVICGGQQIFYPARGNHNRLAKTLFRKDFADERDTRFGALARRISESGAKIAVVSAERFEAAAPKLLHEMIARHFPDQQDDIRLISYVRPHADRFLSLYAERIKGGYFSGTLADFYRTTLTRKDFFYHDRFCRWREVFGERFTLRPMIRSELTNGDVVQDFLHFVCPKGAEMAHDTPPSNRSLSLEDLAVTREFQKLLGEYADLSPETKNMAGWDFGQMLGETKTGRDTTRLRLDRDVALRIAEAYQDDATALDAAFFGAPLMADALKTAPDKAIATPQSIEAKDYFTENEFRLIRAWCGMMAKSVAKSATPAKKRGGRQKRPAGV